MSPDDGPQPTFRAFGEQADQVNRSTFLSFLIATGRIAGADEHEIRYGIHDAASADPTRCPADEDSHADAKHPAFAGIRVELERLP